MRIAKEPFPLIGAIVITFLVVLFSTWLGEIHPGWSIIRKVSQTIFGLLYVGLLGYTLSFNRFKGDQFYPLVGTGFWLFLPFPFEIIRVSWSNELSRLFIYLEIIIFCTGILAIPILYYFRQRNKKRPLVRYERVKGWLILGLTPLILMEIITLTMEITILFRGLFLMLTFLSLIVIFVLNDLNLSARRQKSTQENYQSLIEELGEPPEA